MSWQDKGYARKSPGTAAVLAGLLGAFGIMGIGHFYVGRIGKAIGLLVSGLIMAALIYIFLLAGLLAYGSIDAAAGSAAIGVGIAVGIIYTSIWIWQIYDAYNIARIKMV